LFIDLQLHYYISASRRSYPGLIYSSRSGRQHEWRADALATGDVFYITDALEHPLSKADPLVVDSSVSGFMPPRRCVLVKVQRRNLAVYSVIAFVSE